MESLSPAMMKVSLRAWEDGLCEKQSLSCSLLLAWGWLVSVCTAFKEDRLCVTGGRRPPWGEGVRVCLCDAASVRPLFYVQLSLSESTAFVSVVVRRCVVVVVVGGERVHTSSAVECDCGGGSIYSRFSGF